MRRTDWLKCITMMLMMMFLATACSDGNSDEEKPKDPQGSETPISNGDWQVVPATGGTIQKGDITIVFPSGTFDTDTKIAITSLEKGKMGGKYEASKFYMVTIPSTTNKGITIKLKSTEKEGDDIHFVMESPGVATSTGKEVEIESYLDAKYSNGEYVATLPAIDNGKEIIDNLKLTFGVAHLPQDVSSTRGTTILGGKVGTVKWEIKYPLTTLAYLEMFDQSKLRRIERFKPVVHECIKSAITQINNLGFKIEEQRILPIYLENLPNRWGQHNQSTFGNSNNSISISLDYMSAEKPDTAGLRNTVIHELFHYFQAEFDSRFSLLKGRNTMVPTAITYRIGIEWNPEELVNEMLVIQEMASVWIEQFTNGGQLDARFLLGDDELIRDPINYDYFGFIDILNCRKGTKQDKYQNQGYSMAPILYYITSQLQSDNSKKIGNDFVLDLFNECKDNFSKIRFSSSAYTCLKNVLDRRGSHFLYNNGTEDYILKLMKGELVKGFYLHTHNVEDINDSLKFSIREPGRINKDESVKLDFSGDCYPYGCSIRQVYMQGLKDVNLSTKRVIVKQETEGIETFLLITDKKSNFTKFIQIEKAATKNDSIVVEGSRLEKMRLDDGTFTHDFFLVTMRTDCKPSDAGKKKAYKLSFELREVKQTVTISPKELSFKTGGGTKSVAVEGFGFKHISFEVPPSWLGVKVNENDKTVEITAKPNLTGKERKDTVMCYVTNADKPTDKDKTYLPVTVTQSGKAPTVSPTSLTFEAEGGMKSLKVTIEGYRYFGCTIDDGAKSWLSRNYVSGGTIELTAEPNTTGKERTTTVKCYATNAQKGTDSETYFMNVKVTQKAGKEQTAAYEFVNGYINVSIRFNVWGNDSFGEYDLNPSNKEITVTPKGKGLHFEVNVDINEPGYTEKIRGQFDIDDLTLMDSKKSSVTNLSWQRDVKNIGGRTWGGGFEWAQVNSQTMTMRFSTNSKIPQTSFEQGGANVMWWAGLEDFSPTVATCVRKTTLPDENGKTITDVEESKGLMGDSSITVYLHFKKTGK